ncbi:MarR family transcriptional regulator [Aquibium sp. LZ166]|uniref:MarR family transcriptional regulator n=1 Tax=Aquibium pacificus TaxID=3153579 RepID=A0ABV3SJT5_9HYPH
MSARKPLRVVDASEPRAYRLEEQIGFALRKANQRHVAIFASRIGEMTPPQFAALAKLHEVGETSQNQLGSQIAMDAATVKGVIDRLKARGLVAVDSHKDDRRRIVVSLTEEGRQTVEKLLPLAEEITAETLAPLNSRDAAALLRLLAKLA